MRYYPRNEAESDELETFFLRVARKNGLNLRLKNSPHAFVLKWLGEVLERDDTWMEVEINCSNKAVRLDRYCGAGELHEILEKMGVPHEYHKQGREEELSMNIPVARKHLEAAFDTLHHRNTEGKSKRQRPLGGHKQADASHSRS
jgi:hypothetical protein